MPNIDQVYTDDSGRIEIRVTSSDSDLSEAPEMRCDVSPGYALIGGGGKVVDCNGRDEIVQGLLQSSFPDPDSGWAAWKVKSKSLVYPYAHKVRCYTIGMRFLQASGEPLPPETVTPYLDYGTGEVTTGPGPSSTANVSTGYSLISGGAEATQNVFLTQSMPDGNSWSAAAKNQYYQQTGSVKAYSIGISTEPIPEIGGSIDTTHSLSPFASSTFTESGYATALLNGGIPTGYVLTGVGGWSTYKGAGRLLTQAAPLDDSALNDRLNVGVSSKDHAYSDQGTTYVYAIAIMKKVDN